MMTAMMLPSLSAPSMAHMLAFLAVLVVAAAAVVAVEVEASSSVNNLASSSFISSTPAPTSTPTETIVRVPASLSHVLYVNGDLIGQFLAYITLAPIYVGCYYLTLIVSRRDIQTMLICVGQVLTVLINYILKRIIKQPRPNDLNPEADDFGMPSNHAQFIGYFCGIYCIYLMRIPSTTLSRMLKCIYVSTLQLFGVLVCFSRYYLKYHSLPQVVWGYFTGICLSVIWYLAIKKTNNLVRRALEFSFINSCVAYLKIRNYDNVDYAAVDELMPATYRTAKDE